MGRDRDRERPRWRETEISGRFKNGETETRLTGILGRETGEVRERGEQEINIKDLSNRQSKERDRDRDTIRETGLERERGRTGKTDAAGDRDGRD